MNITGTSQRTLDRLNRMEDCLRAAGLRTEYGIVDNKVVLKWERIRHGFVVETGHLFAVMGDRTGNLRFCGGTVSAGTLYEQIRTYREAWDAVGHAVERARRDMERIGFGHGGKAVTA